MRTPLEPLAFVATSETFVEASLAFAEDSRTQACRFPLLFDAQNVLIDDLDHEMDKTDGRVQGLQRKVCLHSYLHSRPVALSIAAAPCGRRLQD